MKRILITGANSYIGTTFEKFIMQWSNDYQVDTLDMMDGSWRNKSFEGYDVVFHVAGIAHSDRGKITKEKERLYYSVNTELTVETAKKAKVEGVKQFVFMSSAIVYGDSAPVGKAKVITKETPLSPVNCYGDSKVQAEKGLARFNEDKFKVVILRPPMIYGKGSKGNYPLLSKLAKVTPVFPKVKNQRSMLYIGNLMQFVKLMIDNEEQGIFWPQNNQYSNTSELVRDIAASQGKRLILISGFELLLRILGKWMQIVNKVFGNLCYDQQISKYKDEYQIYSLKDSIELTEQ